MAGYTVARYTGSVIDVVVGSALVGIAVLHLTTGAAIAILPLVAAGVLFWSATVLAPVGSPRAENRGRSDGVLFVETMGFAVLAVTAFVWLGTFG